MATIRESCKQANISTQTYYARRRKGMTHEEALTAPRMRQRPKDGKSLQKQCAEAGLSVGGYIYRRKVKGMTHEEALSTPAHPRGRAGSAEDWQRIEEQCANAGISVRTYRSRIAKGMSPEEALTASKWARLGYQKTIKEQCLEAGISARTYRDRRRRGMSHEDALSAAKRGKA